MDTLKELWFILGPIIMGLGGFLVSWGAYSQKLKAVVESNNKKLDKEEFNRTINGLRTDVREAMQSIRDGAEKMLESKGDIREDIGGLRADVQGLKDRILRLENTH